MKNSFISIFIVLFMFSLIACNTSENIKSEDMPLLRSDGLYIAINPHSHGSGSNKKGKQEEYDVINILRFYSLDSGIVITDFVPKNFAYSSTEIKKLWIDFKGLWKGSHDKDYKSSMQAEMFAPKIYSKDSIKFSQLHILDANDTLKTNYLGKAFKDSLALNFVIQSMSSMPFGTLPPCHQTFKFYTVDGK